MSRPSPASQDSSGAVVAVRGLRKAYGSKEALRGIDLEIRPGEVFALLGPNGAGKTTCVEILEGYRSRDGGDVSVLGHDPARGEPALKARIGIVLQSSGGEHYLAARELIDMYGGYYPRSRRSGELLELVGLDGQADTRVRRLSGGQRRRLDLAVALVGDPELLFLDEPTTGFDPGARRGAWSMVRSLTDLGKTVLLTTHLMDEASALADRLAVLVDGRIVAHGSPAEVVARHSSSTRVRVRLPEGAPALPADLGFARTEADGGWWEADTDDPTRLLHGATSFALSERLAFEEIQAARPSLEEVYLALTGHLSEELSTATADSVREGHR